MDNHNRLLAMLNQAATSPAVQSPPVPQHQQSSPSNNPNTTSGLIPPSGAVREPSPFPPPPSLQSVTLNDLFRGLGSPPPFPAQQSSPLGSNSMNPSAMNQTPPGSEHQNKLLGMLGGPGAQSQSQWESRPNVAPPSSAQAINLLSMFKSPPPQPSAQSVNSPQADSSPIAPSTSDRTVDPSPPQHASGSASPQVTQVPEAVVSPAPKVMPSKSPFDFVSPFDVFDKPSPKPAAVPAPRPAAPPAQKRESSQPPTQLQQAPSPQVAQNEGAFAVPPARINGTTIHPGKAASRESSEPPVPRQQAPHAPPKSQAEGSSALRSSTSKEPVQRTTLPWQASKASAGIQSRGPRKLGSHAYLDFSTLSGSAGINLDGFLSTDPVTKLKDDKAEFRKAEYSGRIVAMSNNWIAYGLTRGRIRLIDITSGSKLLLQLPDADKDTKIVDITTTSTLIGVLADDFSITVFKVPSTWNSNDAEYSIVSHTPLTGKDSSKGNQGITGPIISIEFFEDSQGQILLAVGGSNGVAMIKFEQTVSLDRVAQKDILKVEENDLIDFCFNHTRQVIAILTWEHLSIFDTKTRERVFHKPIITEFDELDPSSIHFCGHNILIGRDRGTVYELIQIAGEAAVLSSIELVAPEPSPPHLHYTHAIYDPAHSILWVAAYARASLLGFRYILDSNLIRDAAQKRDQDQIIGFDQVIEIPLGPIVSFAIQAEGDDLAIFYATSEGYSKSAINKQALELHSPNLLKGKVNLEVPTKALTSAETSAVSATVPPGKPINGDKKETKSKAKPAAKVPVPAPVPAATPPAVSETATETEQKPDVREMEAASQPEALKAAPAPAPASPASPDVSALLKQTEDRLANRIKQTIEGQISSIPKTEQVNGDSIAAAVSAKIGSQLNIAVSQALQQELKKSLVPAATSVIQDEIRSVAPNAIQSVLAKSLSTLSKDVEASITSSLPRILSNTIQPAVDRVLNAAVMQTILPHLTNTSEQLADRITEDFKSEMVQIRKDFHPPPPPVDNSRVLHTLVESVAALQRQVEQLSKITPAVPAPAPPPPAVAQPLGFDLEDVITQALVAQGPVAIIQLVNDFWGIGGYLLPLTPDRKPPVSQIIVVTLLHRLAAGTMDLNPNDPNMVRLISWARRAAMHLNPNDPSIKLHVSRIIPSVVGTLETTITNLMSRFGGDVAAQHVTQARVIIEILQSKQIVQ